jgi:hypothetical protein
LLLYTSLESIGVQPFSAVRALSWDNAASHLQLDRYQLPNGNYPIHSHVFSSIPSQAGQSHFRS